MSNYALSTGGGISFDATSTGTVVNSIIYFNTSSSANSNHNANAYITLNFNCTAPSVDAYGMSNITANPQLVSLAGGNYRLSANSPCVNTGTNLEWMASTNDLDNGARIVYDTPDMGCYEYPIPELVATPTNITDTAMRGALRRQPVTLLASGIITNYGTENITWYADITNDWIVSGLHRGTVPAAGVVTTVLTNVTANLTAGAYHSRVVFAATNRFLPFASLVSQNVDMVLQVMELTTSSNGMTNAVMTGALAPTQTFYAISSGSGSFDYTVTTNGGAAWLTVVSGGAGTLVNNASNAVRVSYSAAALPPGRYTDALKISTTNHGGATQTVSVVLDVMGLGMTPSALTNQVLAGFNAPTQALSVSNIGGGTFSYILSSNVAWLSVTPSAGVATNTGTNHIVAYSSAGLAAGSYTGVISAVSAEYGGTTQTIVTVLNVMQLARTPAVLTQSMERSGTAAATNFLVWNGGAGNLSFTAAPQVSWLTISPTGGTSVGASDMTTIAVGFAGVDSFDEGAYTGAVVVSAADGGGNVATQLVTVVFNVLAKVPESMTAGNGDRLDGVALLWENTAAQGYEIWRAQAEDLADAVLLATVGATNQYLDTSALYGEPYYYRVRPVNRLGGTGRFSPSDLGWRGLTPPTNLTASQGLYTNKVVLTWAAAPNAQRYEVWRSELNATQTAARITSPDTVATNYVDYAVTQDTVYYYWVKAKTAYTSGFSDGTNGYSAAILPPGTVSASQGLYTNKVRIIWGGVSGAVEYELWRAAAAGGPFAQVALVSALGYDDYAVTQGERYYYQVRASSRLSRSAPSTTVEGYADIGRAGLTLRDFTLTPTLLRAGGAPAAMSATLENLGPRSMLAPDYWVKFELILSPTPSIDAGTVAWSGSKVVQVLSGNAVTVDFADLISLTSAQKLRIPTSFSGEYYVFLRANHTPPSTLTDAGLGSNVVMLANPVTVRRGTARDCTGDWRSDLVIYHAANGVWGYKPVAGGPGVTYNLSLLGGRGIAGDFDGDGLNDAVMYNNGTWTARLSGSGQIVQAVFGGMGGHALSGDLNNDGISDPIVYHEAEGAWYALLSSGSAWQLIRGQFGGPGWRPLTGDFDGDGCADPTIYNAASGEWLVYLISNGRILHGQFGGPGWQPLVADFDGDGISDAVLYAETSGMWMAYLVGPGQVIRGQFGGPGNLPLVGDFDGDGISDAGLYRAADGHWFIVRVDGEPILWNWIWGGEGWLPVQ